MSDQRTIWRRRAVLMAAIALIVAVPLTIALRGGEDEPGTAPEAAALATSRLEIQRKPRLDVALRVPDGWTRKQRAGSAIAYRSKDRSVLVAISSPGPVDDAGSIHEAAVSGIKGQYRAVDVVKASTRSRLGGQPARTAAIAARNPKTRDPVRILVATAKGRKRAYLVEVFAAGSDPTAAHVEAQVVLAGLRLQG
jgi:hypothetical protein